MNSSSVDIRMVAKPRKILIRILIYDCLSCDLLLMHVASCLTIDHKYIPYAFTSRAQQTYIYLTINDLPAL